MNDNVDKAFEPMDAPAAVAGPQTDGTVTYQIVEGDTFVDGELVKSAKVIGEVQIEADKVD
jgi:hypothetical protein